MAEWGHWNSSVRSSRSLPIYLWRWDALFIGFLFPACLVPRPCCRCCPAAAHHCWPAHHWRASSAPADPAAALKAKRSADASGIELACSCCCCLPLYQHWNRCIPRIHTHICQQSDIHCGSIFPLPGTPFLLFLLLANPCMLSFSMYSVLLLHFLSFFMKKIHLFPLV